MHRWAANEDKQAVMDLWAVEFESYEPYYSWYFKEVYRPELTLCDFEGKMLAAAVQLAPYTLCLNGEELPVCYVVGVITAPAFRKQGRSRALLEHAHEYMQQTGCAASLLYTDIPQFYQPLGYTHFYHQKTLRLPVQNALRRGGCLNIDPAPAESVLHRQISTDNLLDNISPLSEIYQSMTSLYNGYILRNEENWRIYLGEQACDNAHLLLCLQRSYVLYTLSKEQLHIIELGFSNKESLQAALISAAQAAQEADVPQLLWHAPINGPALLPHIPAENWQPRPFVMVRTTTDIPAATWQQGKTPLWINEYT